MSRQVVHIRQPVALRIYVVGFGTVWCAMLVSFAVAGRGQGAVSVVPLLMLGFGATLMYRMLRVGVVADESGLLVRNSFRTKRFSWSEVEDFRVGGAAMGMPFGKVVHVLLRNGEVLTLDVTMRPWLFARGRARLDEYVQALRSWLSRSDR